MEELQLALVETGLEAIVAERVSAAAADDAGDASAENVDNTFLTEKFLAYLQSLDPEADIGKKLSSSPVIRVKAIDDTSVTFIVRGRLKLGPLKGYITPFVRLEARFSKAVAEVPEITTFIAELHFRDPDQIPISEVRLGLGWDGLAFMGRGTYRLLPIGFGLDLFLGGLSSNGVMLGIDLHLPAPIPLGMSFGLNGLGGDYAHGFKPRLEAGLEAENPPVNLETGASVNPEEPAPIANPTAYHYVLWARNPDDALDRWVEASPEERAKAVGVRASFCDLASTGYMFTLDPVGFAVIVPGPTIILGGQGLLLSNEGAFIEGFAVIDVASKSFALGGGAELVIPAESGFLIHGEGTVDLFFSISEPRTWFIHFGTRRKPNKVEIFQEWDAEVFLELDHFKIAFGGLVSYDLSIGLWKIFKAYVKWGLGFATLIGWNPGQVAGEIQLLGEIGIIIWKIKLSLAASAKFLGHFPRPKRLVARVELKIDLPWPVPDPKIEMTVPKIETEDPPEMRAALLAEHRPDVHVGALHPLTGRQWDLDAPDENALNLPWPDVLLVVHFSRRLEDETGKVLGPPVSAENNGGYLVHNTLTVLELTNLDTEEEVEGVQAVWAESPDGEMAQLHILAQDPFAWLSWSAELTDSISTLGPKVVFQRFGIGPGETFSQVRAFGELEVAPQPTAELSHVFSFALPSRTVAGTSLGLSVQTASGTAIPMDGLQLYAVEFRGDTISSQSDLVVTAEGTLLPVLATHHHQLLPGLNLVTYRVLLPPSTSITSFELASSGPLPFHLYGVLYREARAPIEACNEKVILTPGRYRLRVAGDTTATSLHEQVEPDPIEWELTREFEVIHPPSLRPYLRSTTLGDSRLFRTDPFVWNPTPYGIGFPGYRAYLPVMRFATPYLSRIFETIRAQVYFEGESTPALDLNLDPVPNSDGESSTTAPSEEFLDWVGCSHPPDEELVLAPLPESGPAELRLAFAAPGQDLVTLDRWDCHVSRFQHFKEHVQLHQTRLKLVYTADGPQPVPSCSTPGLGSLHAGGNNPDTRPSDFHEPVIAESVTRPRPFPEELSTPTPSWRLPSALSNHLENDTTPLSILFARFAHDSGAVFSADPAASPLQGIGDTVGETTVQGLADSKGRLFALWLRTPEPLDWRRVTASLRIRHFREADDCPPRYAFRSPLNLEVEILPGPDGSSAFLVGKLASIHTRLPRGDYELTLSFDADTPDLPKLKALRSVGPEEIVLQFIQLSGPSWPLPGAPGGALLRRLGRASASSNRRVPRTTHRALVPERED